MPFAFKNISLWSQLTDYSADFVGGKSRIDRDREVMQPELGFAISGPDVDMARLATLVRIEERSWSTAPAAVTSNPHTISFAIMNLRGLAMPYHLNLSSAIFALTVISSVGCSADVVPGLVKAATEIGQAYGTYNAINKAVTDAENKIKPTTDFSGAAKNYENADTAAKAIQFPPEPVAPNGSSIGPVNSCATRNSIISALSSGIGQIQNSITLVNSETAEINTALADLQQSDTLNIAIQKAIPQIAAIPIWGDEISADVFSMTQRVQKAAGDARTPLNNRLKQNNTASQNLAGVLPAWQNALNAARQFSNAPTPGGSYAQSCNSCSHDCEQLTCNCRRINGSYLRTSINYPSCHR